MSVFGVCHFCKRGENGGYFERMFLCDDCLREAEREKREEEMADWEHCYNCEDGYSGHDCGEDCCPCLDPEENMVCQVCEGRGGWKRPQPALPHKREGQDG